MRKAIKMHTAGKHVHPWYQTQRRKDKYQATEQPEVSVRNACHDMVFCLHKMLPQLTGSCSPQTPCCRGYALARHDQAQLQ